MKLCDLINWFDPAILYTVSLLGGIKPNPIKGVIFYFIKVIMGILV
jgi:hypothetical protein